ncbi:MAG: type I-E CRISPR-associated protein Cas5/CasD [Hyphomicrobium sp.]|nr:type I-E CRISPR-associated protein Cas5/CasD [Hyphomicrobium sp.]
MKEYLVFTLAAPLASFGAVAVGERRPTWDRPSKSQVLGLIAGALGIERTEETRQNELAASLGFAVRVDSAGTVQTDYHTTQVPPARRNRRFATRADELAVANTELRTILSRRELRSGSHYTIALWASGAQPLLPGFGDIATALKAPVFTPFAGRKANVLMLPMTPRVVSADDVTAAFTLYDSGETDTQKQLQKDYWLIPRQSDARIYADADSVPRQLTDRIEQRRDIPESRAKWRFGLRAEALLKPTKLGDRA